MKYVVYKLRFKTGVHFGNGLLNDGDCTFRADTLFSALYIEACKAGMEKRLYDAASSGRLVFSDAFPYIGDEYMLPKPLLDIVAGKKEDSGDRKKIKKMKYLPADQVEPYLAGRWRPKKNPMDGFGGPAPRTVASVRGEVETLPYHVGTYYYKEGNGLYFIMGYEDEESVQLTEQLLEAVSFTGIGGKKSAGLGKFDFIRGKKEEALVGRIQTPGTYSLLLCVALPREDELASALEGASYLLEKRSGFIASFTYAEEFRKKKDLYVFASGSCFRNRFSGGIYDVSEGGKHPVYRYAVPLFMGV